MASARYKLWQWGGPIGEGATGSYHAGVAGVAKTWNANEPYIVSNELVCGELGRAIRLPVPPGFIIERDGVPYHVSLNFNLSGENLPPADAVALVANAPTLACGIVLFDIWIMNDDRHQRNLSFDTSTRAVQLFDHSHAFMRGQCNRATANGKINQLAIGNHCLAPHLLSWDSSDEWIERIMAVPEFFIRAVISDAAEVGLPSADVDFHAEFLLDRRKRLVNILKQNGSSFPKIPPTLWVRPEPEDYQI